MLNFEPHALGATLTAEEYGSTSPIGNRYEYTRIDTGVYVVSLPVRAGHIVLGEIHCMDAGKWEWITVDEPYESRYGVSLFDCQRDWRMAYSGWSLHDWCLAVNAAQSRLPSRRNAETA